MFNKQIKIGAYFIGGLGLPVAEAFESAGVFAKWGTLITPSAVDTHPVQMRGLKINKIYSHDSLEGAGGNLDTGQSLFENIRDQISEDIDKYHLIVLIGGLAGGTAAAFIPLIADICKKKGKPCLVFAGSLQSYQTGSQREKNFERSLEKLDDKACYQIIHTKAIEEGLAGHSSNTTIKYIAKIVLDAMSGLCDLVYKSSIDFADLKHIVFNKSGRFLIAKATGQAVLDCWEKATDTRFLYHQIKNARGYVAFLEGRTTNADNLTLTDKLRDRATYNADPKVSTNRTESELYKLVIVLAGMGLKIEAESLDIDLDFDLSTFDDLEEESLTIDEANLAKHYMENKPEYILSLVTELGSQAAAIRYLAEKGIKIPKQRISELVQQQSELVRPESVESPLVVRMLSE